MPQGLTLAPGPQVALDWLRTRNRLLALLGNDPIRVTGHLIGPYPILLLRPLPSPGLRDNGWISDQDISLAAVGSADIAPSEFELWTICCTALEELVELPNTPVSSSTQPVCTYVKIQSGAAPVPDQGGHPRYIGTARLTLHPGRVKAVRFHDSGTSS